MASDQEIVQTFPAVKEIESDDLQEKVVRTISNALEESNHDSIETVPFAPRYHEYIGEKTQVEHINEVTEVAISLTDALDKVFPGIELDRNAIIAGALLHDISKFLEYHPIHYGEEETELGELLKHPHYAVHMVAREGFPLSIMHIIMAHTDKTTIEPQTIEAYIVSTADHVAVRGLFWEKAQMLKPED